MKKKQLVAIGMSLLLVFGQSIYVGATEDGGESVIVVPTEESEGEISEEDIYEVISAELIEEEVYEVISIESDEEETYEEINFVTEEDIFCGSIQDSYEPPQISYYYDNELMCASDILESSYNGYEQGYLPAIRDQNPYGTCWAHSSIGCLETYLSKNYATNVDLSEIQIAYFSIHNYDDPKNCHDGDTVQYTIKDIANSYLMIGGTVRMAYHEMMNLVGPTDESILPYSLGADCEAQDMYALGYDTIQLSKAMAINIKDTQAIKEAVKEYGGVGVSYFATGKDKIGFTTGSASNSTVYYAYCNKTTNTAYCNAPITNHAVMIVGWDDSIKADQFGEEGCRPKGDGAWLIRNSWGGDGYGYTGYFYLSYYDESLLSCNAAYVLVPSTYCYDNVYSYEGHSTGHNAISEIKSSNSDGSITKIYAQGFSQEYTVNAGERIEAVAVEIDNANLTINVEVKAGDKVAKGSLETVYAGYYTVVLDNQLDIYEDTSVTLTVMFSKPESASDPIKVMVESMGNVTLRGEYGTIVYRNTSSGKSGRLFTSDGRSLTCSNDFCAKIYTTNIEESIRLEYVNLSLSGNIGLNLYLETYGYSKSQMEGLHAVLKCGDDVTEQIIGTEGIDIVDYGGRWYYRFSGGLAAKDWDKEITVKLYDQSGNLVPISNSNMSDRSGFTCSISGYIKALQNRNDDNLTALTQYLACYCEYAACYLGETAETDIPTHINAVIGSTAYKNVLDSLDTDADAKDAVASYEKTIIGSRDEITYLGSSLVLNSTTGIRHYFSIDSGCNISDYNIRINGTEATVSNGMIVPIVKGLYYIEINNIIAAEYSKNIRVTIGNDLSVDYSVYSYIYDALASKSGDDSVYIKMVKLMYMYGEVASDYYR